MSSTSTTWTTDTNTKSGSATTYTNTVSSLQLLAAEGEDAILKLFADKSLKDQMGENARNRVAKQFNWEKNVIQMVNIYQKMDFFNR